MRWTSPSQMSPRETFPLSEQVIPISSLVITFDPVTYRLVAECISSRTDLSETADKVMLLLCFWWCLPRLLFL